jgi:hypothetical protein
MITKASKLTQTLICFMFVLLPWPAHSDVQADYAAALNDWQQVLSTYVDAEGRIDFIALADNTAKLQNYVTLVAAYGPSSNPAEFATRESVLAYHINTYNALAMHGVISEGIPEGFDSFFKRAGFFRFRGVTIDGQPSNLYDYENKVIRPLNDPRIHFALNCMVRDCPRLPQTAFTADRVNAQLDQATREFSNSSKYVQVDHEKKQVKVSAIFDFYTKDFVPSGKTRDLPDYINRYRSEPLPQGYKVRYMKYDWTINQQPAAGLQVPD